jgi:uncharacterized protein YecE (DUF72 family)
MTLTVAVLVGTSGWQYADWRRAFYPADLAQRSWLEHYAEQFAVVEVNNTFYRLPPRSTFEGWRARTPEDFEFAVKASRYLTHVRRLKEPGEPLARMLEHARGLGGKLGPVLVQLPPNLEAEPERLAEALGRFPSGQRVAVEPRHESWFVDDVYEILARHDAALCLTDRGRRRGPIERTADWVFLRFHQGTASPRPCYGERALEAWVHRLCEQWPADADFYVFFNNDTHACAPRDASRFARLAARAGLRPTRTPDPATITVGGVRR